MLASVQVLARPLYDRTQANSESFSHNSQLVKSLTYHVDYWHEHEPTPCCNLSSLQVHCIGNGSPVAISQFDQLRDLSIIGSVIEPFCAYWRPANHFQCLSTLDMELVGIKLVDTDIFWNRCLQLGSLRLGEIWIPGLPDTSIVFERLQKLSSTSGSTPETHLKDNWTGSFSAPTWLLLEWDHEEEKKPRDVLNDFASHFAAGTWSKMCEPRQEKFHFPDTQLAQVIEDMLHVTVLRVRDCEFGRLSFAALRRHLPIPEDSGHRLRRLGPIHSSDYEDHGLLSTTGGTLYRYNYESGYH